MEGALDEVGDSDFLSLNNCLYSEVIPSILISSLRTLSEHAYPGLLSNVADTGSATIAIFANDDWIMEWLKVCLSEGML